MTDSLRLRIANALYQELSVELPAAIRGADAVMVEVKKELANEYNKGYGDGHEEGWCEGWDANE